MDSQSGDIYANSMLQASGNYTRMYTKEGNIKFSTIICNSIDILADEGSITGVELLLGAETPKAGYYPLPEPYALPHARLQTRQKDISLLGLGGSPLLDGASKHLFVQLITDTGNVKVEVNGGGFEGTYDLRSGDGSVLAEINGVEVGHKGFVGADEATGMFNITSNDGDVQWAVLPSPF